MTDFDEILKQKKTITSKPLPASNTNVSSLDRKIAEIKNQKQQEAQAQMVTMRTDELTDEKRDTIPPAEDQRVLDAIYNKPNKKHRIQFARREKNFILAKETEGTKSRQWMVFTLGIIGLFFLMSLQYIIHDQWVVIIVLMLGSFMFLPVGMIIGWATLDPYVRCKLLKKISHKNYGIINFVGKGQKIISKIKNFDQGLVWKKNETWVITKEHVYQLSKDGDSIVEKSKIDPESIITLIDTVPVLFVDLDSMQPLSLARDRREGINPLELGSTLKAWVDNQLAKAMFLKKTMDMYLLIIIIISVVGVGMGYMNMNNQNDLAGQVKVLHTQLNEVLSRLPPTV